MRTTTILLALALLPAAASADKLAMKTGLWEMQTEVEMDGRKMKPPKLQRCITEKDLDGDWLKQGDMKCKVDQKITASTVTWTMDCAFEGGGTMKATGNIKYTATSYEGTGTSTMTLPGGGTHKSSSKISGKYLGACKK